MLNVIQNSGLGNENFFDGVEGDLVSSQCFSFLAAAANQLINYPQMTEMLGRLPQTNYVKSEVVDGMKGALRRQ